MVYNYNFALGSIFFLGLTLVFYLRQDRRRDLQDRLYTLMLFGGLTGVCSDFLAALLQNLAAPLPALYAVNMLFLLGGQLCLPAFFLYAMSAAELYNRLNKASLALILLPFVIVVCLVLISPLGVNGVFYIDQAHTYQNGAMHEAIYITSALYIGGACLVLAFNFRVISPTQRVMILFFVLLIFVAITFQISHPVFLLTTAATALALTGMYYLLRAPGEQVDPLTGAFCRALLPSVLDDLYEKQKRHTLVLYSLLNYDTMTRCQGVQFSDNLLIACADWLRQAYPQQMVVYMDASEFAVIIDERLSDEELHTLHQRLPLSLTVEGSEAPVQLAMAAILQPEGSPPQQIIATMDYLYRHMPEKGQGELMLADRALQERCSRLALLENDLDSIARQGQGELLLQPVLYAGPAAGAKPALLDAALAWRHPEQGLIEGDKLLQAVNQSADIHWYYQQLLTLTAEQARHTAPDLRFCLPLFAAALIEEQLQVWLSRLTAAAGLQPPRIMLRLKEKDLSAGLPLVQENIHRLSSCGFSFRLDGFAQGYGNISLLTALPISTIMIGNSLLRNSRNSRRDQELLGCVISILKETGKEVICAGVDSHEDAELARAAGAPLLHGLWSGADQA